MERAVTTASSLEAEQDSEGSGGFHQIIDFLSASHIKYALTEKPTIYASLIEQFWKTAALNTIEDGVMAITATIDRNVKVLITEASIRRHLKLGDSEVKTSKARSKARIVILEDEDAKDPSKQGRSLIEELDMDVDISLVPPHATDQGRKLDDTQVSCEPEDQLGVFSAAKVLADAAEQRKSVGNVQTYKRQRRRVNTASILVSTADVSTASEMVNTASLKDVMDLHRLVKERYTTTSPDYYDLMLWGDLKTLFEPDEENKLWKNQHEYNLISWRLYDSSGIHILLMDNGIAIHMLIEKKYPLGQEMISKMLNKRVEMGLLYFVNFANPFKVKTGERTLAENEVPLLTEIEDKVVSPVPSIQANVNVFVIEPVGETRESSALKNEVRALSATLIQGSSTDDFYESQTIDSATALNVYSPNYNVTSNARIDNPAICQNFLDHRDAEITNLKAKLERSKAKAVEVTELRKRVFDLEATVAAKISKRDGDGWLGMAFVLLYINVLVPLNVALLWGSLYRWLSIRHSTRFRSRNKTWEGWQVSILVHTGDAVPVTQQHDDIFNAIEHVSVAVPDLVCLFFECFHYFIRSFLFRTKLFTVLGMASFVAAVYEIPWFKGLAAKLHHSWLGLFSRTLARASLSRLVLRLNFCNLALMPSLRLRFALSTYPLICGCLTDANLCLMFSLSHRSLKGFSLKYFSLSDMISSGRPNLHTMLSQRKFLIWVPVIVTTAFASIHLLKQSIETIRNFTFPCASRNGPDRTPLIKAYCLDFILIVNTFFVSAGSVPFMRRCSAMDHGTSVMSVGFLANTSRKGLAWSSATILHFASVMVLLRSVTIPPSIGNLRRDLLENLYTLEVDIHRAVIAYGILRMKENEVNALKVNGKLLNEEILHEHEIKKSFKLQSQDVKINPVQAVDDSLIVSKSSWIESENNSALNKSVNETQLQQHESLVIESTTLEANLNTDVKALDDGSVITESSGTKSDKHDTSSSSRNYFMNVVDGDSRPINDQVPFPEVDSNTTSDLTNMSHRGGEIDQDAKKYQQKDASFQRNKLGKNQDAPEFWEFFEINDLKAQLQAKTALICNLKNQIKSVKEATPYVPPSKKDYEILFQPLFDEYFKPPPRVVFPYSVAVVAPRAVDLAGLPLSTTIDQDVPYA
nr:hypothetical protein [Tanacetum cinerariifolium]